MVGGNVPGIPGACATGNFTYLARGPCNISGEVGTKACWLFPKFKIVELGIIFTSMWTSLYMPPWPRHWNYLSGQSLWHVEQIHWRTGSLRCQSEGYSFYHRLLVTNRNSVYLRFPVCANTIMMKGIWRCFKCVSTFAAQNLQWSTGQSYTSFYYT